MRPSSLWVLSLGFAVLAVPAHATPRGSDVRETRHARYEHPKPSRGMERESRTIQLESRWRNARAHRQLAMRMRNDDLAQAFSGAYETRRSFVPQRSTRPSFSGLPHRWLERADFSNVPSRHVEEDVSSSGTPRILPESAGSTAPVPEPTGALLFGGGLVLLYTLAARRREHV